MKNEAIAPHGSGALPAPWEEALALLDQDLRHRGIVPATRTIYARDVEELFLRALEGDDADRLAAVMDRLARRLA